jgi:hypothetical protein
VIWPLDSNDLERLDRPWVTKEESPPRLVAGGRPGVACDARASKVARRQSSRNPAYQGGSEYAPIHGPSAEPPSVAERGAVPGCVAQSKSARSARKGKAANVETMTAPRGPIANPAPVSVSPTAQLVQKDQHVAPKTIG